MTAQVTNAEGAARVVAYVPDLMDRGRLASLGARFVTSPEDLAALAAAAELVVLDLNRPAARAVMASLGRLVGQGGRAPAIIGFAPHVDDEVLAAAKALGIEALPRSVLFRRVAAGEYDAGAVPGSAGDG